MMRADPGAPRAAWPRSRRVLNLLRGAIAAMLDTKALLSFPVLRLLARSRAPEARRLAAGTNADGATGAPEPPRPLPTASIARDLGPRSGGAGNGRPAVPPPRRAARRSELFAIIRVDRDFDARSYARTFAALQVTQGAKMLDLTAADVVDPEVFAHLAGAWTASSATVPRLGVLLTLERWVMLESAARSALRPIADRGVAICVFYAEQALGGRVDAWFTYGLVVHNVRGAVATLAARWQPAANWPIVLEALADLTRSHAPPAEMAMLLTEIAGLALSCGGAEPAARLTREALYYLPDEPSVTRCKALRELGVALMSQGQTVAGMGLLDQAITVAALIREPALGASALCQSGAYALNHGDYPGAERRFREAITLMAPARRSPLLALAHHNLAIALMHQGSAEAEHHAMTALELRPDPQSHLAEEDRILLARLREARAALN